MNKFNNWDDLKKVKKIVTEQHLQNEAAKAKAALKEKQRQAESRLFEAALGPVKKLAPVNRASLSHNKPAPLAKQFIEDEQFNPLFYHQVVFLQQTRQIFCGKNSSF